MSTHTSSSPAPGDLEVVQRFLNTWVLPSATNVAEDHLPALLADGSLWKGRFPELPIGEAESAEKLLELRDDLRSILGAPEGWVERLNGWLQRLQLVTWVEQDEDEKASLHYWPRSMSGAIDQLLLTVVLSIEDGSWFRLKSCPNCYQVFYDSSRSKTRVWCGMVAGEGGKGCGSIAKVRRYRERHKQDKDAH